ncbi:MAG TPA: S-adenosylmethionine decarboxylase [Acidimicrobiales bacterium]|nr:S-adenosylmethionine decarboxylase [Acidimicrobiales bacterium]
MPRQVEPNLSNDDMCDLAPMICRQRLVVEGVCSAPIGEESIRTYLSQLSDICGMRSLMEPVTHYSERYGWAGWIHWEASGAHCYAWENPLLFFSVDVYTCKPFDRLEVVDFTARFFEAKQVAAKAF